VGKTAPTRDGGGSRKVLVQGEKGLMSEKARTRGNRRGKEKIYMSFEKSITLKG